MTLLLSACSFLFTLTCTNVNTGQVVTTVDTENVNFLGGSNMTNSQYDGYLIYSGITDNWSTIINGYSYDFRCVVSYTNGNSTLTYDLVNCTLTFDDGFVSIYNSIDNDANFGLYNFLPTQHWVCPNLHNNINNLPMDYTFTDTSVVTSSQFLDTVYSFPSVDILNQRFNTLNLTYTLSFIDIAGLEDATVTKDYTDGYSQGRLDGYEEGRINGYQDGYTNAKNEYENADAYITGIFDGILSVGLIPLEFFLTVFNFEIFGINVASIVSALLTMAIIIIVMRIILGKGD